MRFARNAPEARDLEPERHIPWVDAPTSVRVYGETLVLRNTNASDLSLVV